MARAAVFVALTGALAALLALLAALVAARRGLEINLWTTMATALVVGVFLAFLWLGPRKEPEEADGFEVVGRRRTRAVAHTQPERRARTEPKRGAPPAGAQDGRDADGQAQDALRQEPTGPEQERPPDDAEGKVQGEQGGADSGRHHDGP